MPDQPTAYATTNPDTVAAFLDATTAQQTFARRVCADAKTLGRNGGVLHITRPGGGHEIVGLATDDPTNPPDGWTHIKSRNRLEPRRGKAGDPARQWLADHTPPAANPIGVLTRHGLPGYDTYGDGDGRIRFGSPTVFAHAGAVWALYRHTPSNDWIPGGTTVFGDGWAKRPLSEYYAAREAFDAAHTAQTTAA